MGVAFEAEVGIWNADTGQQLAGAFAFFRARNALDVVLITTVMKKGRAGTRVEVVCRPDDAGRFESYLLTETTTIGVRRADLDRVALARTMRDVQVLGHRLSVKVFMLPGGGSRVKPEYDDVRRIALATGRRHADIYQLALQAAERT